MSTVIRFVLASACVGLLAASLPAADEAGGYLGVQIRKNADGGGVYVVEVTAGSPADKAGLKANDVITKIDGKAVEDVSGFVSKVRDSKPGDKFKLTIERVGKEMELKVTLGKRPAEEG